MFAAAFLMSQTTFILYVFYMYLSTRKNHILEVRNWHVMMIFKVVAICDQLAYASEIAICDVIYPSQNKKPTSVFIKAPDGLNEASSLHRPLDSWPRRTSLLPLVQIPLPLVRTQ